MAFIPPPLFSRDFPHQLPLVNPKNNDVYNRNMLSNKTVHYQFCPMCTTPLQAKTLDGKTHQACPSCDFIHWDNPKPAASIILSRDGDVLLLRRAQEPSKGYWVLPGGYVGHDENPQMTVIRETREETGLDITVGRVITTYLIDTDPRGNSVDIVFAGTISGGKMKLTEHSTFDFFQPDNLPELIAYKHREAIDIWRKHT